MNRVDASFPSNRPRSRAVAVVLAIVAVPLAMLYLGRWRRAAVYLVLTLASALLAYELATAGVWPAGVSFVVPTYAVALVGIVDAYRIAGQLRERFHGGWYSRWQGLVGIAAATAVVVLTFRAMAYEPFRMPSSAMLPTLQQGDLFFVCKSAYGWRLPFMALPFALERGPVRGDVIVFRAGDTNYLKRVIGLPGDVVEYDVVQKQLTINGETVDIMRLGAYDEDPSADVMRESLDGRTHSILLMRDRRGRGGTYTVPPRHYFVLGDHRDNSRDSRFPGIGFVPRDAILGRARLIWWNTEEPARAGTTL